MAINLTDFDKIWASSSPLTPYSFSDANYEEGWNFVGSTPPARQMWDGYMKFSDEKQQYIVNNFLPLSGGTMTGAISRNGIVVNCTIDTSYTEFLGGSDTTSSYIILYGKNHSSNAGVINMRAYDGINSSYLKLTPTGDLTWGGKDVERVHAYSISASAGYVRYASGLQMVWGSIDNVGTTAVEETYEVAFSAYPSVTATANSNVTMYINANNSTRFTVRTASGTTTVRYIAIGKWQ